MIRIDHITWWTHPPARRLRAVRALVPRGSRFDHAGTGRKILDDISCSILPGELTVLLGPNGAGKSTLLRMVSGEKRPHAGTVFLDERSIHTLPIPQLALRRGVLTQHYSVSLPFTVEEVVTMGRYPHCHTSPSAKDKEIVSACLQEMQVDHLAARPFNTLSGGEQQRVQMARVLAQLGGAGDSDGPPASDKILLLDEPTASMDLLHQQQCLTRARQLAKEGATVVAVLHDLNLAARFADSLLLLKDGQLLAGGRPSELLTPDLIYEAYGIKTSILYPGQYDFPVIIPALPTTISSGDNPARPDNHSISPNDEPVFGKDTSVIINKNNYFHTPINEKIYANDHPKGR